MGKSEGGQVLAQIRFFGLSTARVVAANYCSGDRNRAYKVLGGLVARRELYRHERGGTYFTRTPKPLPDKILDERFAVLWHCRMRDDPVSLLSPREMAGLFDEMKAIVPLERPPRTSPCVHTGKELLLLRVHPARLADRDDELNRALGRLQKQVSSPTFEPWWHFIRHGLMRLVYILTEESKRAELERWVQRHPVMSYLKAGLPLQVPITVAYAPRFPGAP